MAQGTSLGILLLPIGILGVLQYYKAGYVDARSVIIISLGFLAGSYFGSKIALSLSQETVKKIFAIVLLLIAFKMLFLDEKIKGTAIENEKVNSSSIDNLPNHKQDINC
jgi:uncharacterized membrane protein YfcA